MFLEDDCQNENISLNETSQIIHVKTFATEHNIDFYLKNYPVKSNGDTLVMYKAVRKNKSGQYFSNYNNSFTYEIGETKEEELSKNINDYCGFGIHISHLQFAVNFGKNWDDLAILEVEVNKKDTLVAKDCDGKIRTSELKVIRELEKSEYEKYL